MLDSDLLVVWMPTRVHPRTVVDQAHKFGLSITEGSGEPEVRAAWGGRAGAVFSVSGWQGDWQADRLGLPDAVLAFLATIADAEPAGFEMVLWRDPVDLGAVTTLRALSADPLPTGVCLRVLP
jgi:hypothetical protein